MKLLSITALAMLISAGAAAADCTQVGPDVTCQGHDADGFDSDDAGLIIVVAKNASLFTQGDALKAEGDDVTVINDGEVDGGDEGIVGGTGFTLLNGGTVTAGDKAVDADDLDGVTVVNSGTIRANEKGIRIGAGNGARLTNTASAVISAGFEGFEAGDGAVVINLGQIEAGDDAVQIGERGLVTNGASGSLLSQSGDAIDIDGGVIRNDGLIQADAPTGAGIDVDAARSDLFVTNAGVIRGGYGILVEDGTADPEEDPANLRRQIIRNAGLIEGTAGTALFLGAGDDALDMTGDGEVIGDVDFGADNDTLRFLAYSGSLSGAGLFDGGPGMDSITFGALASSDIVAAALVDEVLTLQIRDSSLSSAPDFSVASTQFERYIFSDGGFTVEQLCAGGSAPGCASPGVFLKQ